MKYGLLGLLAIWLLIKGVVPGWTTVYSDFSNYYVSSCLVLEQADLNNLYDNEWFHQQIIDHGINQPGKFSPFPPVTAWIMLPLAFADALTAMRIWIIVNLMLLVLCIWLIHRITQWLWVDAALLLMASGIGLVNDIKFGQVYLLISAGMLLAIKLSKTKRKGLAGWLLGVLTWIKYVPLALVVGYFADRNYKVVRATGLSLIALLLLQFIFFGNSLMYDFFYSSFLPHLDGELSGQEMYSYLFQSWDNFFRHAFVFSAEHNPYPWIDWPEGRTFGKLIVYAITGLSLLMGLRKVGKMTIPENSKFALNLSLPMLAVFVVLPASATYHFILLVVPVALLIASGFFTPWEKAVIITVYVCIGFIPYGQLFNLAEKTGFLFAYPRLGLVSLLFFSVIVLVIRKSSQATRSVFAKHDTRNF